MNWLARLAERTPRCVPSCRVPALIDQPPRPLLRVRDLAVSFESRGGPPVRAVDGVRMTIYPRQTVAVVGESGCGKSVTALSTLQLIPRPPGRFDRGEVWFDSASGEGPGGSVDLLKLGNHEIRRVRGNKIAMIFQEPMTSLNPVYTVGAQICEAVRLHQLADSAAAWEIATAAMRDVGIPDAPRRMKSYPHEFSGGMRQRVMIAMALACQPKLLLADEPTTALDVTIQAQILELLAELKRGRGMGVMLITHDLGIVAGHADVVCVMYGGRVVEYAGVHELFRTPLHPYTRGLLACIPRLGERRERLTTVKDVLENESEFCRLSGSGRGVRPWWPGHAAPRDLVPDAGSSGAGDYTLCEVEPEHWVGLWRTEAVGGHPQRDPDISYLRVGVTGSGPESWQGRGQQRGKACE